MHDTRLVQTAVLGRPGSTEPVYFPPDREDAVRFRNEHRGSKFYCGHLLGGCGGELSTRISDFFEIVPHFAHHPDAPPCLHKTTYRTGASAADHLYVHNGLIAVGARSGRKFKANIDIDDGRCGHVLLHDESPENDPSRPDWNSWLKARGVTTVDGNRGPRLTQSSLVVEAAAAGRFFGRSRLRNSYVGLHRPGSDTRRNQAPRRHIPTSTYTKMALRSALTTLAKRVALATATQVSR